MYIISSTDSFATDLTLATFWMVVFLGKFYGVSLNFLFANTAFILLFHKTFLTIGSPLPLKEFSTDFLSTTTAFETFFVVKLSKCSAAFVCHNFITNATISNC